MASPSLGIHSPSRPIPHLYSPSAPSSSSSPLQTPSPPPSYLKSFRPNYNLNILFNDDSCSSSSGSELNSDNYIPQEDLSTNQSEEEAKKTIRWSSSIKARLAKPLRPLNKFDSHVVATIKRFDRLANRSATRSKNHYNNDNDNDNDYDNDNDNDNDQNEEQDETQDTLQNQAAEIPTDEENNENFNHQASVFDNIPGFHLDDKISALRLESTQRLADAWQSIFDRYGTEANLDDNDPAEIYSAEDNIPDATQWKRNPHKTKSRVDKQHQSSRRVLVKEEESDVQREQDWLTNVQSIPNSRYDQFHHTAKVFDISSKGQQQQEEDDELELPNESPGRWSSDGKPYSRDISQKNSKVHRNIVSSINVRVDMKNLDDHQDHYLSSATQRLKQKRNQERLRQAFEKWRSYSIMRRQARAWRTVEEHETDEEAYDGDESEAVIESEDEFWSPKQHQEDSSAYSPSPSPLQEMQEMQEMHSMPQKDLSPASAVFYNRSGTLRLHMKPQTRALADSLSPRKPRPTMPSYSSNQPSKLNPFGDTDRKSIEDFWMQSTSPSPALSMTSSIRLTSKTQRMGVDLSDTITDSHMSTPKKHKPVTTSSSLLTTPTTKPTPLSMDDLNSAITFPPFTFDDDESNSDSTSNKIAQKSNIDALCRTSITDLSPLISRISSIPPLLSEADEELLRLTEALTTSTPPPITPRKTRVILDPGEARLMTPKTIALANSLLSKKRPPPPNFTSSNHSQAPVSTFEPTSSSTSTPLLSISPSISLSISTMTSSTSPSPPPLSLSSLSGVKVISSSSIVTTSSSSSSKSPFQLDSYPEYSPTGREGMGGRGTKRQYSQDEQDHDYDMDFVDQSSKLIKIDTNPSRRLQKGSFLIVSS
ncbi:hypothetical protein FBU30_006044 [Linnemannia zychae]|nr:hypothetical protein FBU30_006044 [Linnemannia zychae]